MRETKSNRARARQGGQNGAASPRLMPELSQSDSVSAGWHFDNTYAGLPEVFFTRSAPVPVREPQMAVFNKALADEMGLDSDLLGGAEGARIFAGNAIPQGAEPIAQAYAGHQFGHPAMLGDGRAILLGEHVTPGGVRLDVQLKGAGQTPYSRRGDGRAGLGPMLREYIISEAMAAQGIPTTRSLAVVTTGESVRRETPLRGAVLTRIAASHIRVGTFEYAARIDDRDALEKLTDYTLRRHFPEHAKSANPALALLEGVIERQSSLVARWMLVGFIHGVMNTDNMALSGETIDYGPCAFMDTYDPATVFSSIDHHGRYAYGNQPTIAHWNLARLAESLLPLLHADESKALEIAQGALAAFPELFRIHWLAGMRAKLGLFGAEPGDPELFESLLRVMKDASLDYTNTFRSLDPELVEIDAAWHQTWQTRLRSQGQSREEVLRLMRASNPAFIPRNHRVEEALSAAESGDLSVMNRLLGVLKDPFVENAGDAAYTEPAASGSEPYQTFCGT